MHQKSLVQAVQQFAPVFAGIIRQGITAGLFHTEYSLELSNFYWWESIFYLTLRFFPEVATNTLPGCGL
jgi:hypothetical protein